MAFSSNENSLKAVILCVAVFCSQTLSTFSLLLSPHPIYFKGIFGPGLDSFGSQNKHQNFSYVDGNDSIFFDLSFHLFSAD